MKRVLAFSLIIIAYLMIPVLILIIILVALETAGQMVAYATSGDTGDLEAGMEYLVIALVLVFVLRRLVHWARE